jgi:hypothetical protein
MVSGNPIDRLNDHIDRIELVLGARPPLAVIQQRHGESVDEASERHYRERPADRYAELKVIVLRFSDEMFCPPAGIPASRASVG